MVARIILGFAFLLVSPLFAQEEYYVDIWLFIGTPQEMPAFINQVEIIPVDSNLELAPLKSLPAGSENKIKATMLYALSNMHQLLKIEDTFYIRRRVKKGIPIDEIAVSRNSIFRVDLSTRSRLGQAVPFQAVVTRSKEGVFEAESLGRAAELDRAFSISSSKKKMECLIEQELILKQDDPIILATSSQNDIVYAVFLLRSGAIVEPSPKVQSNDLRVQEAAFVPKAVDVVEPLYPRELKSRQIGGEVQLVLSVDERGRVLGVVVVKPIHPYLNYCAVQAFLKWTFNPVIIKGKPVRASFPYSYRFDPSASEPRLDFEPPALRSNQAPAGDLGDILAHARDYCRMISGAALDFICEETIREHHYNLVDNINEVILTKRIDPIIGIGRGIQLIDPKQTIVNRFICDYQLIRKANVIEERRIILKDNGRNPRIPNRSLEEKRFSGLSSLLSPLRVLSGDQQDLFYFAIDKKQRMHGRDAFVIDGIPFSGDEDGIWRARIWIDAQSYRILKYDVEGIPLEGYDEVLNDCASLNIEPSFKISLEFGLERNGIFFPSSSRIRVTYPAIDMRGPIEKLSIDIRYDKYKFFTVETQSQIIK